MASFTNHFHQIIFQANFQQYYTTVKIGEIIAISISDCKNVVKLVGESREIL